MPRVIVRGIGLGMVREVRLEKETAERLKGIAPLLLIKAHPRSTLGDKRLKQVPTQCIILCMTFRCMTVIRGASVHDVMFRPRVSTVSQSSLLYMGRMPPSSRQGLSSEDMKRSVPSFQLPVFPKPIAMHNEPGRVSRVLIIECSYLLTTVCFYPLTSEPQIRESR